MARVKVREWVSNQKAIFVRRLKNGRAGETSQADNQNRNRTLCG